MKNRSKHLFGIFLFIVLTSHLHGMTQKWIGRYTFSTITMEQGLPHNYIDALMKDSEGFLWIATNGNGIARYDSYEFISFSYMQAQESHRLRNNFVRELCEDKFKRLWVASEQGIDLIDLRTLQLVDVNSKNAQWDQLRNQPFHLLYVSKAGNLWMASYNLLYKIVFDASGNIDQIFSLPRQESVRAVCEIDGYLYINYNTGIYRFEESCPPTEMKLLKVFDFPSNNILVNAFFYNNKEIWMGTNDGIFCYNRITSQLKRYSKGNYVTDVTETNEHNILAATLKGLKHYDLSTDSFEHIDNAHYSDCNALEIYGKLECNFVNCLLNDGDIIWIGTEAGGLIRMNQRRLQVWNYVHSDNITESIARNPVNAIYEDEQGMIWVGTVENGISCLDPQNHTFEHYTTKAPAFLSHNSVSCFTTDGEGRLWIGTWGGGFGWLDIKHGKRFHHITNVPYPDIPYGHICAICYDAYNNYIWLTTPSHIYAYDLKKKQLKEMLPDKKLGGIAAGNAGYCIDKDSCLWLGLTAGLCRIDLRTVQSHNVNYRFWRNKLDDPSSGLKEKVSFIQQAADGSIWIGSNGYGVYKAQSDGKGDYTFQAFTTQDGLVNNAVRGILEDYTGNIWFSTINGLSCYSPVTNLFHNYTRKNGLVNNQFYWNAAFRSRNGELYWGTVAGLSVVSPNLDYHKKQPVPLKLINVLVSGHKTYPANQLTLHERDKNLQIKFAALDYEPSNSAVYSYRLLGFEEQWIRVNASQRTTNYTNLRPGKYVFELRYSLDGKEWMPKKVSLPIIVKPYFYRTLWFRILLITTLAACIYILFAWKIRLLKKQRELLRMKVNERTSELEEQRRQLFIHTEELSRQNVLLTQQNEKIENQKAELIKMSQKMQEIIVSKINFFTNITHEFRTPLTLIAGPIQRALKLSRNPLVIEQLKFVERNSRYLLSLINQLMDFRKVESGKIKITCHPNDLSLLLENILLPFRYYASNKRIVFRCFFHLSNKKLLFDADALEKVFINLIFNASKFTPTGGTVSIYAASIKEEDGNELLYLGVRDTGTGIVEEDLEKIFDQFYQSSNKLDTSISGQSGTGIGLYICKHIVQLHNGRIWVKNNAKIGCTFRILLLLQQASEVSPSLKQNEKADKEEMSKLTVSGNKLTILIVEDNKDMRDYIHTILSELYNVLEALNGEEALEILQHKRVDFIISDLMMPVMDGMELSSRVKANLAISHIPFLMLTAKTSSENRIESFKIGVDEYLLKPFDDELLLVRIANILENRRKMQQRFSYDMNIDILCTEEESNDKKFLNKAMQIVKENYKNSEYGINDFVTSMNVSRSVVYRKFESLTGQSIGNFIRNYRLNIAYELILQNKTIQNLNISEIAYEVGFNDPKYFTRCFTKHFHISPSKLMERD